MRDPVCDDVRSILMVERYLFCEDNRAVPGGLTLASYRTAKSLFAPDCGGGI